MAMDWKDLNAKRPTQAMDDVQKASQRANEAMDKPEKPSFLSRLFGAKPVHQPKVAGDVPKTENSGLRTNGQETHQKPNETSDRSQSSSKDAGYVEVRESSATRGLHNLVHKPSEKHPDATKTDTAVVEPKKVVQDETKKVAQVKTEVPVKDGRVAADAKSAELAKEIIEQKKLKEDVPEKKPVVEVAKRSEKVAELATTTTLADVEGGAGFVQAEAKKDIDEKKKAEELKVEAEAKANVADERAITGLNENSGEGGSSQYSSSDPTQYSSSERSESRRVGTESFTDPDSPSVLGKMAFAGLQDVVGSVVERGTFDNADWTPETPMSQRIFVEKFVGDTKALLGVADKFLEQAGRNVYGKGKMA